MPGEFLIALIALLGVLLSAVVSLIASKLVVTNEVKKLRFEAKKTYDSMLLEKRLDVYPGLYFLLSNFIKEIQYNPPMHTVELLLKAINEWDSKNALLFSAHTARICYEFRRHLQGILKETEADFQKEYSSYESQRTLRKRAAQLEFALKSDLGIYGIKASDETVYDVRMIESFEEISGEPKKEELSKEREKYKRFLSRR